MSDHLPDVALQGVIATCRSELSELYAVVQQEQRRKLQRWQDEEPMLECQIEALSGTREIIQREQKQLAAELANLKAFLEKQAAEAAQHASAGGSLAGNDEAQLQQQLQELTAKITELDGEITELVPKLSSAACREDELSYYETKLVVIQDTRRLLQSEATALSAEIKRRQTAARLEAGRHTAAQMGLGDLGRLGERLAGVEAALDRAKVERYFPAQRGFRFQGGGGGVYCGVKDLHLSEVSGAFNIALEAAPAAADGAAGLSSSSGQREVRLKVTLSGISTGSSSQDYKQQQQQQRQQQAAKAAAQAKSLKRQQSYQQQQQQQSSPMRRSTTTQPQRQAGLHGTSQLQQQQGTSPTPPAANGSSTSRHLGGGGGNRRNAAVAKFLGQLNEKKDALSNAIKTSPLSKGLEASLKPDGPRLVNPAAAADPGAAGFSRHLAGTFGDKAAGFSHRRGSQTAAVEDTAEGGLLGGLAGMGIAGSSNGLLESSSSGGPGAGAPSVSGTDGSSAGGGPVKAHSREPADTTAAGPESMNSTTTTSPAATCSSQEAAPAAAAAQSSPAAAAAVAAAEVPQPHSPTAGATISRLGLQGRTNSSSSTGSGSWPQPDGSHDGQLKAKLGSMKGKLGGLLADSKQKLADSKQKLADSKLVQESKQKLADSKQKLADSKLFTESRAAAKNLLEDSKHLFEDSRAGIKKGLSTLGDRPQQTLPAAQQQQQPQQQPGNAVKHSSTPRSSLECQQAPQQAAQQQQQETNPAQQDSPALGSPSVTTPHIPDAAAAAAAAPPGAASSGSAGAASSEGPPHPSPSQRQQQQQQQGVAEGQHTQATAAEQPSLPEPAAAAEDAGVHGQQPAEQAVHTAGQPTVVSQGVPAEQTGPKAADGITGTAPSPVTAAGGIAAGRVSSSTAAFPGVAAASAAAASSGDLDRQLLDEAWIGDEQGGAGQLGSSGWLPGAAAAAGVAGGKGSGSRKGVVVMLLAEGLEILGEKGTKVPNIRAARLGLEVECVLTATLTYSSALGWQSAGLSFEVVSLERVVEGSNIPVPKTLIKSVLNLVMPSVFTKLLLTSLPHELGQFILDSASAAAGSSTGSRSSSSAASMTPIAAATAAVAAAGGAGVWLSGELCLTGPPTACLSACLTRSAEEVPAGRVSLTNFVQELRAAQKARALLNLPDPLHCRALALLFTPGSPYCLLDSEGSAAPGSTAAATAVSSSTSSVLGIPAGLTLRELSRFYLAYSDSSAWSNICEIWQVAVDAMCLHLARAEGLLAPEQPAAAMGTAAGPAPAAAEQQFAFSFEALLTGRVAGLVRKPVRLCFGLNKLLLGLDAAAGLSAVRDYCERAAREFAEQAKGEDALLLLQRPLSQQLELLHLWHAAMSTYLCSFLQQFNEAGGRVMVAADKGTFSIAVEELGYEGPLKLQIPLPLLADLATGACNFDLSLPDPRSAVSSLANKLRFVSSAITKAAFGKCEEECTAERHAAAVAAAQESGSDIPLSLLEELEALMTIWNAGASEREQQAAAAAAQARGHDKSNHDRDSSTGIKLSRVSSTSNTQRSSSTAAAAATVSITRNSLTSSSRTASVSATSAPATDAAGAAAAAITRAAVGDAAAGMMAGSAGADGAGLAAGGRGVIGRVCLTKASAGLVLDEKRLKELMSGGGFQDAGLLSGLLGCFGQLFTATIAPGWAPQQQDSLYTAAADPDNSVSSTADGDLAPQAIVTLRNNEVTRVKANLEAAAFESAVSPRIAVRLLHMLLLAVAHKFGSGSSKRLEVIHKVFTHVAEYLGRDCLDLLVCVDVAATATEAQSAAPTSAARAGTGAAGAGQLQDRGPALQLLLSGAAPGATGAAAGPTGGSSASSGGSGACCFITNDVNLLTVLETVRLLMDYSS